MSCLFRVPRIAGMALVAALGAGSLAAAPKPAHADAWFQFGIAPSLPPVAVVPSPPPVTAYNYAYTAPYRYSYVVPYYARRRYRAWGPAYVYRRREWSHRRHGDWDDRDDD